MKKLINVLRGEKISPPPIWIMRQAGRYLPEYREIRSKIKSFLDLCYTPKLACEVTLQPIQRFDFDAAIIFSDILVIPHALGVPVEFNDGPKLGTFEVKNLRMENIEKHLSPVFEALELVKSRLSKDKALIGFSGAPWTLAYYMKSEDEELIEILTESVIRYLSLQIQAGADVIKIFDSWAGIVPSEKFEKLVLMPAKKITSELRRLHPQTPLIYFPRGIGERFEEFARIVAPHGLALDQNIDRIWARKNLQENIKQVVQGNLDNSLLAFGSKSEIEKEVVNILETFGDHPFVFNLGHGILPETPIENVELVMRLVRKNYPQ
ncbi:MAG: uroporphyrinogen decarboxylase [Alphaproteobacteria bacterium]|nr:uroporphyrinogen decarboxylase [Alphaproteobacteria bacterium]